MQKREIKARAAAAKQATLMQEGRETGAASIFIELSDGIITVTHGTDKVELFRREAHVGDWDKIWKAIRDEQNEIDISWHVDDVKEVRPDLDDEQCRHVLEYVRKKHDAGVGVNWEVLELTADHLFPLPQEESQVPIHLQNDKTSIPPGDNRTFKATWTNTDQLALNHYTPSERVVYMSFFSEGNGYEPDDIEAIDSLQVGQTHKDAYGNHDITRIS